MKFFALRKICTFVCMGFVFVVPVVDGPAFAQGVQTPDGRAQAVFNTGMEALEQGDKQTAIVAFERVLRLDPRANNVRVLLGSLYLELGNAAQAEFYLSEAISEGGIPADTLPQVQSMLVAAKEGQRRVFTSGSVTAGLQYETNANGGPDASTAFTSGTALSDFSVVLNANYRLEYLLRSGFFDALRFDGGLSVSNYGKAVSPSSEFVTVSVGPVWSLDENSYLNPRLMLSHGRLRGDSFRNGVGLGVGYETVLENGARFSGSAGISDETFSGASSATNVDRSGPLTSISGRFEKEVAPKRVAFVSANASVKDAAQDYQSFTSYGISGGQIWSVSEAVPDVLVGFDVGFGKTSYDGPDLVNSTTVSRKDDRLSIGAFVDYPLRDRLVLTSRVEWTDNQSNYATEDSDNFRVFVGLRYNFGG